MSQLKEFSHEQLIQIFLAISTELSSLEIQSAIQFINVAPNISASKNHNNLTLDVLLYFRRRDRILEFLDGCKIIKPSFTWQDKTIPSGLHIQAKSRTKSALFNLLLTKFTVDEYKQLCFFIQLDYEEIEGLLIEEKREQLTEKEIRFLNRQNFDVAHTNLDQIRVQLKEIWIENFYSTHNRLRLSNDTLWNFIVYMKPEEFLSTDR